MTWKEFYLKHIEPDLALYFVILAELCSSLMLVASKLLQSPDEFDEPMNVLQILFVRMVITYLGTIIYLYWAKVPDAPWGPRSSRKWLVLRGTLGCIGVIGLYSSVRFLSVSDSMVISFLSPSVTAIMATFLLRERVRSIEWLGGFLSMIGVILIARPSFLFGTNLDVDKNVETADPYKRFLGIVGALVGVFCNSAVYILIRFLGKDIDPVQTVSYFASVSSVLSFSAIIAIPSVQFVLPNSFKQWFYMIAIGFSGFFMQFLFTAGLQREKASRTSAMMYTQIVFGLLWEYLVWRHTPNIFSWLGIIFVLGAAFFTLYYKPADQDNQIIHVSLDEENSIDELIESGIHLKDLHTTKIHKVDLE